MKLDIKAALAEIRANEAALRACPGPHKWEDITPERPICKTFQCALCKGTADSRAVYWYGVGLKQGGGKVAGG
jgi:hypothetical protein